MRRLLCLLALLCAPLAARAQGAATVRGTVHDSLTGFPLAGASVQLVARDPAHPFGATATTDSAGAFAFADVPEGAYAIGFYHPLLDSLGMEPPLRPLAVRGGVVRTALAVPSAATLHTAICGPSPHPERQALVVGFVRHATTGAPVEGATVRGEWLEFVLRNGALARTTAVRTAVTGATGWYALCQLPAPGTLVLQGGAAADSTDRVEVEVTPGDLLRQPLLVAPANARAVPLSGTVRTGREGREGRPLPNVVVTVGGRTARTNERGEWRLPDVPVGTRTLEVRAVGYFPVRLLVQATDSAPPVHTALVTLRSVLDTVKVIANYNRYTMLEEFRQRAQGGMGRFLTAEQIAQRVPIVTSDLFRAIPGVYLEQDSLGPVLTMKGIFADRCTPAVYLNGFHLGATSLTDIDMLVKPETLLGVEVYAAGFVPPQFEPGMSGCGSLVFWTR